jgi:hypothetical protein
MKISSRTRDWPACVKYDAADHTQLKFLFSAGYVTELTIVSIIRCVRSDTKMGPEVVGTHAGAPHRVIAPHSVLCPACVCHALQ